MKIKDYKCKCGHDDFFFSDKGNQKGIYCSYCGRWLKWADKDEQNLAMKQEPCEDAVSRQAVLDLVNSDWKYEGLETNVASLPPVIPKGVTITDFADKCRECGREKVLDKIRAEIKQLDGKYVIGDYGTYGEHSPKYVRRMEVLQIIDKYKAESEE